MNKKIFLSIITFAAILVVGYSLLIVSPKPVAQPQPSVPAITEKQETSTKEKPVLSTTNTFSYADVHVGQRFGSMIVESITSATKDNVQITFTGPVTLEGKLSTPAGEPGMGPDYSVSGLTQASIDMLPREVSDVRNVWFGITNPESVIAAKLMNRDPVEVTIHRYDYIYYPSEVWNTADVLKIRKL
jgi:hypothetical protein